MAKRSSKQLDAEMAWARVMQRGPRAIALNQDASALATLA